MKQVIANTQKKDHFVINIHLINIEYLAFVWVSTTCMGSDFTSLIASENDCHARACSQAAYRL